MEKIGLHNYEAWFLDYFEENLSENQIAELNFFLNANPDLRIELEEFEAIAFEAEPFNNESLKAGLIREETTGLTKVEYLMIAEVEGTITKNEKIELAALVAADNSLSADLALFHKTKLPKETQIAFAGKSALIQKEKKVFALWTYASGVAAAVVIAFVVWNANLSNQEYNPRGFAWQENQQQFDSVELPGIVAAEEMNIQEMVKKLPTSTLNKQFAQGKNQKESKKAQKRKIPMVVKSLEQENLADQPTINPIQEDNQNKEPIVPITVQQDVDDVLAEVTSVTADEDFVPIQKFAKDKIKKDLLKGKTFSETVIEEIAEISNEKVTFETDEDKGGLFDSFALNIGKLSISRNR